MNITRIANVKAAVDSSNTGRDSVDIICRYFPDDSQSCDGFPTVNNTVNDAQFPVASEGAVVIFATQPRAIIGVDITVTGKPDSYMVAGIVSESGGIASGEYGKVRIYGYFDDVITADSTDAVAQGTQLGTSILVGQVGATAGTGVPKVGIALEAGSGSDGAEVQSLIRVTH